MSHHSTHSSAVYTQQIDAMYGQHAIHPQPHAQVPSYRSRGQDSGYDTIQREAVADGYYMKPKVMSYHSNEALIEDRHDLPPEELCVDCGYELSVCDVCPVSGELHPPARGARPRTRDTLCTDCKGVTEESAREHAYKKLLVASRMQQVQRELFGVCAQPTRQAHRETPLWGRIRQLEKDKVFLVSAARQLGLSVPSHQPPPAAPSHEAGPPLPPEALEAEALAKFNNGLRTLIEHAVQKREDEKRMGLPTY
eukprot:Rhum_TRINITY_DN21434_c0_g1::Rhum_TRINITY_DN21434_c0_g1_i1::g.174061::m.174061